MARENASGSLVPLDLDRAIVKGVPDWVALAPMNVSHAVLMWLIAVLVVGVAGADLLAKKGSADQQGVGRGADR